MECIQKGGGGQGGKGAWMRIEGKVYIEQRREIIWGWGRGGTFKCMKWGVYKRR